MPNAAPTVIRPNRGWRPLDFAELWAFRELFYFLVWRDIKVRYKQTLLGVAWAVLQPVLMTFAFAVFFGRLAKIPSDGVPYVLFALCGLVLWTFFSQSLVQASQSLVSNTQTITKVYFPRLLTPLGSVASFVVDFAIAFVLLIVVIVAFGRTFDYRALFTLAFFGLALVTSVGVSLWFSALNVRYRDVKYVVPFVAQMWLFLSPVAYPSSLIAGPGRILYGLNPMAGAIDGFRWALLGTPAPPPGLLALSAVMSALVLVGGVFYFRRMESTFADII